MATTRSGSKSSKIKLPLVGSVSYLAAAAGVAVIYYMWPAGGLSTAQSRWTDPTWIKNQPHPT